MSRRPLVITLIVLGAIALSVVVVKVFDEVADPEPHPGAGSFAAVLRRATDAVAPFEGLSEVRAAVGHDRCLRLVVADSEDERVAGLRDHTADLGPYDGMLFVFAGPSESAFTMSGVADPLDIAFFDQNGARNATRAMPPCPDKAENECPVYRADGPYVYALETKAGELPSGPITACS
ncbi:MAG TPA: DUF192 domain-containing protein [Acidimicrobiia bacterium]|jgi:uncharacterized membrane protein (UPF0127 family)